MNTTSRGYRDAAWLLGIGLVVLFTNLGGPRLWDRDEPRNAGCTREMLARGDWVVPVFDGELRTHKPILLYWCMMGAYAVCGDTEFGARLPSALAALGTMFLTYGVGSRLFSRRVGFWSAVALVTALMFDVAARAATPDALLVFWTTATLAAYVFGLRTVADGQQATRPLSDWLSPFQSRWNATLIYGSMGMAALAKGPIGVLMPTAILGLHQLILHRAYTDPASITSTNQATGYGKRVRDWGSAIWHTLAPGNFLRTFWSMRPLTAAVVVLVVALPWYWLVGMRTDGAWVRGFLLDHNVGRATQSMEGHGGSAFLFYPIALLVGFFPWSVFAVPVMVSTVRQWQAPAGHRSAIILILCWMAVFIGVFSAARTKLPSYITPCYPAVALLVGQFVVAWMRDPRTVPLYWIRAAMVCLGLVGVGALIGVPLAAKRFLPEEQWLAVLGLVPLAMAGWGLYFVQRGQTERVIRGFALGSILLMTAGFAWGAARVDSHRQFDTLVEVVQEHAAVAEIGTLGVTEPSWVYYLGRPLDHLSASAESLAPPARIRDRSVPSVETHEVVQVKPAWHAWQYLAGGPHRFLITTDEHLKTIGGLPPGVREVARTPYFLQDDTLILLTAGGPAAECATGAASASAARGEPRKTR
jgi:4-amino-4-deoxy-L-arabinose transferase-like glycosyltransferase